MIFTTIATTIIASPYVKKLIEQISSVYIEHFLDQKLDNISAITVKHKYIKAVNSVSFFESDEYKDAADELKKCSRERI